MLSIQLNGGEVNYFVYIPDDSAYWINTPQLQKTQ
jgi:hypothetical protein